MRRPLGIAIIGGLIVSQLLTLYTTPVVYLYLDRFRLWSNRQGRRLFPRLAGYIREPSGSRCPFWRLARDQARPHSERLEGQAREATPEGPLP